MYDRFARWREKAVLDDLFQDLAQDADKETISIDSTSIRSIRDQTEANQKKKRRAAVPETDSTPRSILRSTDWATSYAFCARPAMTMTRSMQSAS